MPFYHPKDTKEIFYKMRRNNSSIENLTYLVHFNQTKDHKENKGNKRLYTINKIIKPSKAEMHHLQKMLLNREKAIVSLSTVCHVKILSAKLNGKLVHGLGAGHVRETSITLHPLYGIPYIPSTSIKGALRYWMLQAFFDGEEERLEQPAELDEKQKKIAYIFIDLFGIQERMGLLQCYDSFPMKQFTLAPDVFTPHFSDYYTRNQPPTDNQNPMSIQFYVVENVEFQFIFSILKRDQSNTFSNYDSSQLLELAVHWCQTMLKETGIGSKTSSGYGHFDQFQDITEKILERNEKNKLSK